MSRKNEAEHRRARQEFEDVFSQLLEEEWQRTSGGMEWSEAAEEAMIAAIRARHRPLSHRKAGTVIDVTEANPTHS